MNTKLLMTIAAIVLAICGIALSFLPAEIIHSLELTGMPALVLQLDGALYMGYAILNWMTKSNLLGGIYGRLVIIANFTHFFVGGMALAKYAFNNEVLFYVWVAGIVYILFALCFGYVLYKSPVLKAG